jgi:hypothetical protein
VHTTIIEFFDPYNPSHIKAYREMEKSAWPKEFLPDGILFPQGWDVRLRIKMVEAWCIHIENMAESMSMEEDLPCQK